MSITIKELTDKAGYNRSTFYEYYTDIYDLLGQVENFMINEAKLQVIDKLSTNTIEELISKSVQFYNTNAKYLYILLGNNGNPAFSHKLKKVLRSQIKQELHVKENNIKAEYLSEFALSATLGVVTYWFERKKDIQLEELLKIINPIIKEAISPQIQASVQVCVDYK